MVCDRFLCSTTAPTLVLAHKAAWTIAKIAHCDISPGNIQIHGQRGILADWNLQSALTNSMLRGRSIRWALTVDFPLNKLMLLKGTLHTMPPRLAFYMLYTSSKPLSRTPWDEMCSVFLCFTHIILDERRDPNAPPLDRQTTLGYLSLRMTQLIGDLEIYCEHHLRPQYKANFGFAHTTGYCSERRLA
jgi:hypothetical protein